METQICLTALFTLFATLLYFYHPDFRLTGRIEQAIIILFITVEMAVVVIYGALSLYALVTQ